MKIKTIFYATAIALGGLGMTSTAFAGTSNFTDKHEWCGGTIQENKDGSSNHRTKAEQCDRTGNGKLERSRAEYRRKSQTSGENLMGGYVKIYGGNYGSLLQALNEKKGSSGSEPIAQLAYKRNGTTTKRINGKRVKINLYQFYVVQGGTSNVCKDSNGNDRPKVEKSQKVKLTLHYKKDKIPSFHIDGRRCHFKFDKTQRVGKTSNGDTGRPFYGKLGLYNTSGKDNNSSVRWEGKFD